MSEFIFVNLIDKEPVGSTLQSIPLHMTALHWSESDCEQHEIIDTASAALQSINKIAAY